MPKYKINVNAFGLQAGKSVEGEPDLALVAAGIFSVIEEVDEDGSSDQDESGSTDSGTDGGDGSGTDAGGDPGTE